MKGNIIYSIVEIITSVMRNIILAIFILFGSLPLSAQQLTCPCNEDGCGDIIAAFKIDGDQTFVCDGFEFFAINNSNIPDVSYYIWDWGDGTRDSVTTNVKQRHVYNIGSNDVCKRVKTTFEICLLAVKKCDTAYSCHSNRAPVTIIHRPIANFEYPTTTCKGSLVTFTDKSCNVKTTLPNAYQWTFHDGSVSTTKNPVKLYNQPGEYSVTLTVKNDCGTSSIVKKIRVTDFPEAKINISLNAKDSIICVGDKITLIDTSKTWDFNKWVFPGANTIISNVLNDTLNWKIDAKYRKREKSFPIDTLVRLDTIELIFFKKGNYNFLFYAQNACDTVNWQYTFKVNERPIILFEDPPQACDSTVYNPRLTIIGNYDKVKWSFPGGVPDSSDELLPGPVKYKNPGNFSVILNVYYSCDTTEIKKNLVVNSKDPVKILTASNTSFCRGNGAVFLKANKEGGIWTGPGITDANLGVFNPDKLGQGIYEITYTIGPPQCQQGAKIQIKVYEKVVATLEDPPVFCEKGTYSPKLTVSRPATKYEWIFPGGNPSYSTSEQPGGIVYNIPGNYDIIVIIYSPCDTFELKKTILINSRDPVKIITDPNKIICKGEGPVTLTADRTGGTWAGNGISDATKGTFNPDILTQGQYKIIYTLGPPGCQVRDTIALNVFEKINATLEDPPVFCERATYSPKLTLSGSATAYQWIFPGGVPSSSTQERPGDIVYNTSGTYDIKVIVYSPCDTIILVKKLYVYSKSTGNVTVDISSNARDNIVCIGDTVRLVKSGSPGAISYWAFPGPNTNTANVLTDTLGLKLSKKIRNRERIFPIDTIPYLDTITFVVLKEGTYKFGLTSSNGCDVKQWDWYLKVFEWSPGCNDDTCRVTVYDTVVTEVIKYIAVTDTLIINVSLPNAFNQLVNNAITVYPNPASSFLVIDYGNIDLMKGCSVRIVSVDGLQVISQAIENKIEVIDLSQWNGKGTYLLIIENPSGGLLSYKKVILR